MFLLALILKFNMVISSLPKYCTCCLLIDKGSTECLKRLKNFNTKCLTNWELFHIALGMMDCTFPKLLLYGFLIITGFHFNPYLCLKKKKKKHWM